MSAAYLVQAKTAQSAMGVGTTCPADALRRAREMTGPNATVSIVASDGATYSPDTFAAQLSGLPPIDRPEPE